MFNIRKGGVFVLFCLVVASVSSVQRQITIYDSSNVSDESFWVGSAKDIPTIANISEFANVDRMLICHEGPWVAYSGVDYTAGVFHILYDNSGCKITNGDKKSFRSLSSTDTSISTISLFESTLMQGKMKQFTIEVPSFEGSFQSIAVTYPGEATLYTEPNYLGLSICLKAYTTDTFWEWNTTALGIPTGSIQSFKFGCHSSNIYSNSESMAYNTI